MAGCRICGGLTRWTSRLCAACGTHLDGYETLEARTPDLLIPVRRYGSAPAVAASAVQQAADAPRPGRRRLMLALAGSGAALGGALALAVLLA